ncbi:hypothetical protein Cni_G11757 [Canna indica]|uniref:Uncharacterized protein n=1 Tax=Canna indica TaxID=4628 RepID=A0AAQ3K6M0_9LILI|nr:hypothetical protein Cni_G11757 [Canna indica]
MEWPGPLDLGPNNASNAARGKTEAVHLLISILPSGLLPSVDAAVAYLKRSRPLVGFQDLVGYGNFGWVVSLLSSILETDYVLYYGNGFMARFADIVRGVGFDSRGWVGAQKPISCSQRTVKEKERY